MSIADDLYNSILEFGEGPLYEEMPGLSLTEKMQNGPTAAHRIEEIHTPLNYAYLTCTTGSSAFQNLVGVTHEELPQRKQAAVNALKTIGLTRGQRLLVSYPPLIGVFTPDAIRECGIEVHFITRPGRDALLSDILRLQPAAVIGESSFLRAALSEAGKLGIRELFPEKLSFVAAGSPMDPDLPEEVAIQAGASLHDLYGCQEFGWLCLDGIPLRNDITRMEVGRKDGKQLLVCGGLPTGDCFPVESITEGGPGFRVVTAGRSRMEREPEVILTETSLADRETVLRCARTILRCKAKIVKADPAIRLRAEKTVLKIVDPGAGVEKVLSGPVQTALFDSLLEAQRNYQKNHRADPVWDKKS